MHHPNQAGSIHTSVASKSSLSLHDRTRAAALGMIHTFVITKRDKSTRFIKRSEMVFLTYCTAPGTSLSINNLWRHSVTRFFTSKQLSRLTVSMPAHAENKVRRIVKNAKLVHHWTNPYLWYPFCQTYQVLSSIIQRIFSC